MSQHQSSVNVRVELSVEELQANVRFLEDQIFRVRFIDPKIPGNRPNHEQLKAAESALTKIQEALKTRTVPRASRPSEITLPKRLDEPDFHRPVRSTRNRA